VRPRNDRAETNAARTLGALDELQRIECQPDFEARLHAEIRRRAASTAGGTWRPLARRFLLPAMIVLLLVLNGVAAVTFFQPAEPQQTDRQLQLTGIAVEFSLTQNRLDAWFPQE